MKRSAGQKAVVKKIRTGKFKFSIPRTLRRRTTSSELKYLDTVEPPTAVAIAGTLGQASLNIIPQDDSESGRNGRKVNIKSMFVKLRLLLPATTVAASTVDRIRIMFIQDKQTNGGSATAATILGGTATIDSFMNLANASRFTVLYDKTFTLQATAGGAPTATPSFGAVQVFEKISKIKLDIPVEFDASLATGALTTQRTNNIFQFGWTENNLITSGYTCRIRYSDP